jgi:hypothetical protein
MTEIEHFELVFAEIGSINSGTDLLTYTVLPPLQCPNTLFVASMGRYNYLPLYFISGHRVYRVEMATFCRIFHHDSKIIPVWSLYLPSRAKLWCTLQLRGQIIEIDTVRHVTGWDKDYLRKIPRVVW